MFHHFVIEHQDEVIDIFIRHTYPNVKDVSAFCNEIQVSDLIAGLLRKLFLFLDENSLTDIISIAMKLNDAQVKNFTLLWMLIRKSDEKSPLFIKNTNSQKNVQERMLKLQLLGVSNKESL